MAQRFFIGGGVLLVVGLILWLVLPIKLGYPPFLLTALLCLIYGGVCLRQSRRPRGKKS
jgi:hypothetical protein